MKNPSEKKRLEIQKTVDLMRLQRKALATEKCYIHWLGSFIDWLISHGSSIETTMGYILPHPARIPAVL